MQCNGAIIGVDSAVDIEIDTFVGSIFDLQALISLHKQWLFFAKEKLRYYEDLNWNAFISIEWVTAGIVHRSDIYPSFAMA